MKRPLNERDWQLIEMRKAGYTFAKMAKLVKNELTGELGISRTLAWVLYYTAIQKIERLQQVEYMQSIADILTESTRYIAKIDKNV